MQRQPWRRILKRLDLTEMVPQRRPLRYHIVESFEQTLPDTGSLLDVYVTCTAAAL